MEISINGNNIDYSLDQEKNVGEILGALEIECEKNGMTITGITVDGELLAAEDLEALFSRAPDEITSLALETMSGVDVVSIMHRLGVRMGEHVSALSEIPVLLQTGDDGKVMEIIHAFARDFESLCQSIPLLDSISTRDASTLLVEDVPLDQYPSQLTPLLGELIEAIKSNDTVLIGDISEYELAPKVGALASVLGTV